MSKRANGDQRDPAITAKIRRADAEQLVSLVLGQAPTVTMASIVEPTITRSLPNLGSSSSNPTTLQLELADHDNKYVDEHLAHALRRVTSKIKKGMVMEETVNDGAAPKDNGTTPVSETATSASGAPTHQSAIATSATTNVSEVAITTATKAEAINNDEDLIASDRLPDTDEDEESMWYQ